MLTKEPGTRVPTPWHQDQPYYNITGNDNVSFWIPIDPVDKKWTLRFVKGSHKGLSRDRNKPILHSNLRNMVSTENVW